MIGCLLGGHGITWEVNRAAFSRVSAAGLLNGRRVTADFVTKRLSKPFTIGGRLVHYRFPKQKAYYVTEAINRLATEDPPRENYSLFREWLLEFRGIGRKTASWITRNVLDCSRIAVIDVHLFRACVLMGLFSGKEDIDRDYYRLEERYLEFAKALGVDSQKLDVVIWKTMRKNGDFTRALLRADVA
jgi:N-glycosylase/DNA lyase